VTRKPEPGLPKSIYGLVVAGHSVARAASLLGVPYVDAAKEFDEQAELNRPNPARARDLARERLERQLRACDGGINAGDVSTLREARGIVGDLRKLDGVDAGPDTDAASQVVKVEFSFAGSGADAKDKTDE
jgi:hypothetical protein